MNLKYFLEGWLQFVVVVVLFCSCGNNNKQQSSILPDGMQEVIDFREVASKSPIKETLLIDGFFFGMSKEQFESVNLKHEQTSFMTKRYTLGGIAFMGRAVGSFSDDAKMYELEITIEKRLENKEPVKKKDFDSIANELKVFYSKDFTYKFADKPATRYPTHFWRKDNLLIELQSHFEHDNEEIFISYTNMPVMNTIQQRIAKKDKERRERRDQAIIAAGGIEIANSSFDASVSQVKEYLKKNLKDPKSYESIEWSKVKEESYGYSVYHKYRAKNSFGGYVIESQIFHLDFGGNVIKVDNVQQ